MLQSIDELIIAGTSSLHGAIKSIQCLRQHDLPQNTWHTSPCIGKSNNEFVYGLENIAVYFTWQVHITYKFTNAKERCSFVLTRTDFIGS